MSVSKVFQKCYKGIVCLSGEENGQTWVGSGFFYDRQHIVTNDHCVPKSGGSVYVFADVPGFIIQQAYVVGKDRAADIAVIKLHQPIPESININVLKWSEKLPDPGEEIVVLGTAFADISSVNKGIVRDNKFWGTTILKNNIAPSTQSISFDGSCLGGVSGSPLLNMNGEIIGISYSGYGEELLSSGFINMAISPVIAKPVIEYIISNNKDYTYGYLGVKLSPLYIPDSIQYGLNKIIGYKVNNVVSNSSASKSGIIIGDIILAVNNKDVGTLEYQKCIYEFIHLNANKLVTLTIRRNNLNKDIIVILDGRTNYIENIPSYAGEI